MEIYTWRAEISIMGEDASIVVTVDDIKTFERQKLISQMAPVKEKINSFERKHGISLKAFEDRIKHLPENFERWDDFIEWKAYADSLSDLESRLKKIEDR
jgi:hypothetical protein